MVTDVLLPSKKQRGDPAWLLCSVRVQVTKHFGGTLRIEDGVPLKSGARECIEWLSNRGLPQSVATSTRQATAKTKLGFHGLVERFHAIVGGDQVTEGKPHPEIYITAARHMGMDPADCIVFEDSPNGVAAANASGATVILVPDIAIHDDQSLGRASEVWDSLEQGPKIFAVRLFFSRT